MLVFITQLQRIPLNEKTYIYKKKSEESKKVTTLWTWQICTKHFLNNMLQTEKSVEGT